MTEPWYKEHSVLGDWFALRPSIRQTRLQETLDRGLWRYRGWNAPGRLAELNPHRANLDVVLDGQFGSTGKGVFASLLADYYPGEGKVFMTNAGPNSGHVGASREGEPFTVSMLPVGAVVAARKGLRNCHVVWTAGAVLDPQTWLDELDRHLRPHLDCDALASWSFWVHPTAAVVGATDEAQHVASTGKGLAPALQRRLDRELDKSAVVSGSAAMAEAMQTAQNWGFRVVSLRPENPDLMNLAHGTTDALLEVPQGFSLGLTDGLYPFTTGRNCSLAAALGEAGVHPARVRNTLMCLRLFPIRVGNTEQGTSGHGYADQRELAWEDVGQTPELTTITKRTRRLFTWSDKQVKRALEVNKPNAIALNFCNYATSLNEVEDRLYRLCTMNHDVWGESFDLILTGWGPHPADVIPWFGGDGFYSLGDA